MSTSLSRVHFGDLPGWEGHDHDSALAAFRRSCREILDHGAGFSRPVRYGGSRSYWLDTCRSAFDASNAARFFESRFRAFRVADEKLPNGLFTGYFEPEVEGSRTRSAVFNVPLYRRPSDLVTFEEEDRARSGFTFGRLVNGRPRLYFTRREIEEGALEGRGLELVWLKDWADAFFIHIQGSGRVRLVDGGTMRLTYEAKSGLPYTGIGALLVERGVLNRQAMSMQAIRAWMAAHPTDARAVMWENQSFIFFREAQLEDQDLGALGAQHVQLTPRRSLAVDRSQWMFGTPVWLDTWVPAGDEGGMTSFRQLLIAQDTGSAIRGGARGDVYWGFGEAAGMFAGPMQSEGVMTVLLPVAVAEELGLGS